MIPAMGSVEDWLARASGFLPDFLKGHPDLGPCAGRAEAVMHGSTTFGVIDQWSDLDFWLLLEEEDLAALDLRTPARFFEFEIDGKLGHVNPESRAEFEARVARCDLPLIAELRHARPIIDPLGRVAALVERALRPMRPEVREAWFRYHFVEMCSERKAGQNPSNRGDALALLQSTAQTLAHAQRAALVLDAEPYPYIKWLAWAAGRTPTGARVQERAESIVACIESGALHSRPEADNPVRAELSEIKRLLASAARERGIDGPWLSEWWLYIPLARRGVTTVEW